ncbi:MAG: YihY/virulence factor BrkB family protein [Balneolaceae bacterium]|jgi:membrane protein
MAYRPNQVFRNNIVKLFKLTYARLWEVNPGLHGAAIAFFTIFSIAPLIIILLWLVSIFLGPQLGQAELHQTLSLTLGNQLTKSLENVVASTSRGNAGLWSSLMASITLVFGATTLLTQVKQTLNLIWGVSDPKIHTLWQFLWGRFIGLLFIGLLSLLFLVGFIFESLLYGMNGLLSEVFGSQNILVYQYLAGTLNVVFAFSFFTALFRVLPDIKVRFRDISVGAGITTILVIAGKALITWYLTSSTLQPAYRAAGSFVVFLVWIYYNVQVVLLGAVFTSVYTRLHGGDIQPYWNATLEDWDQVRDQDDF